MNNTVRYNSQLISDFDANNRDGDGHTRLSAEHNGVFGTRCDRHGFWEVEVPGWATENDVRDHIRRFFDGGADFWSGFGANCDNLQLQDTYNGWQCCRAGMIFCYVKRVNFEA